MRKEIMFKRIRKDYSGLTPGERAVANFIVNNYKKAAFLTSSEIGEEASVSDTTVIRLAVSLGYNNFSDFKKSLQEIVKREITPREKLTNTIEKMGEGDFLEEVYAVDQQNLATTYEEINTRDIEKAIELLYKSRRIFLMGLGLSSAVINFLGYRLKRIQRDVVEITSGSYSLVAQLSQINAEDVLIAFDFPRYSKEIYKTLNFVKEDIKAPTILITDSWLNPSNEYSDITIIAHNDSLGFTNSIIGSAFLANILSVGVILRDKEGSLLSLEKMERFSKQLDHCIETDKK